MALNKKQIKKTVSQWQELCNEYRASLLSKGYSKYMASRQANKRSIAINSLMIQTYMDYSI